MSNLTTLYKQQFGEALNHFGFRLYKKTFYRVTDDVLQTLMLIMRGTFCSIDYNITSLATGISDLFCESFYNISQFREGKKKGNDWELEVSVPYQQNNLNEFRRVASDDEDAYTINGDMLIVHNDGNASEVVKKMLTVVVTHVLPIFERGVSAETAYEELLKIEKMIYTKIPGGIAHHYGIAILCIQFQDYEKAHQHLSKIEKKWDEGYAYEISKREQKGVINEPDLLFDRFISEYQELKEKQYKLSISDTEYLQNYITQKKAKSLEYLTNPRR